MICLCHVSGQADSASSVEISNLRKAGRKTIYSVSICAYEDPEQTLQLFADDSF